MVPWGAGQAYLLPCRRWYSFKVNSNNEDREFQEALEIARQYDAEWLARTLDYNSLYNNSRVLLGKESLPSSPSPNQSSATEESLLTSLGYTSEEIASIKPSAKSILISKRIKKPRSGVPDDWRSSGYQASRPSQRTLNPQEESSESISTPRPSRRRRSANEEDAISPAPPRRRDRAADDDDVSEVSETVSSTPIDQLMDA